MNELIHHSESNVELAAQEQVKQYLSFQVDKSKLAVNITDVKEIIEIGNITKVPMMPIHIRGVINLRGTVVPVIDLSARLHGQTNSLKKRSCIILVELKSEDGIQSLGMLVDQVDEILGISTNNIQAVPKFGPDIRIDFIHAMGRIGNDFILLLDINKVLSISELSELEPASYTKTRAEVKQQTSLQA